MKEDTSISKHQFIVRYLIGLQTKFLPV